MNSKQSLADKAAVTLSMLCVIHCLAVPLLIAVLPAVASLSVADESFHWFMVIGVIPVSAYSLTLGCKKHKRRSVLLYGLSGLFVLLIAALFGHDVMGEAGEKFLTVIGAGMVAYAHLKNYHLCKQQESCHEEC